MNDQPPPIPQTDQQPPVQPEPGQEKKPVRESTFGLSAILGIALVAVIYAAITGETPGMKQGIWLGPIALVLVAPLIEALIQKSKAAKKK